MAEKPIIFVSYVRDDAETARELYDLILGAGGIPWLDTVNVLPGQDWRLEIEKTIKNATFFLALLSVRSVSTRGYVQKELKLALNVLDEMPEGATYIIPLRLDGSPVPQSLANRQWLDWNRPDARERLLVALGLTPSPVRSDERYDLAWRQNRAHQLLANGKIGEIVAMLPESAKIELLYFYKITIEGWKRSGYENPHKPLLYTDLIYRNREGLMKSHTINNYSSDPKPYEECRTFGLGDEQYYVRPEFLEAIRLMPLAERYLAFDGLELVDASDSISPD